MGKTARIRTQRLRNVRKGPAPIIPSSDPPIPGLSEHHCYALFRDRRTYVGYTVDPSRRVRQHNGEIKGGARATSRQTDAGTRWEFLFVVAVEDLRFGAHEGLSLEWHLKRNTKAARQNPRTHLNPIQSRINMLRGALGLPKFAWLLPSIAIFVNPSHVDAVFAALLDLPTPVCVLPIDQFQD